MNNPVGIIDYGCGNIMSIRNAVANTQGRDVKLVRCPDAMENFSTIVLPGVGSFEHAMNMLSAKGFPSAIVEWISNKSNRLIGICLGMQILCNFSEESEKCVEGLSIIDADVRLLRSNSFERLPNIGWAPVAFTKAQFERHSNDYYFVHSYGVFCNRSENCLATSYFGDNEFCSAITNGANVIGFQFHPEKSHRAGMDLLDSCI